MRKASCFGPTIGQTMNKPPQNSAQMSDYLNARKLHLSEIVAVIAGMKTLNIRANKATEVETLTIDAIKAELDFIDLQLKRKGG